MTQRSYYRHEAAEIARLCCRAGVPEQIEDWLREGYSVDEVAANLHATVSVDTVPNVGQHGYVARPPTAVITKPAPVVVDDWGAARAANRDRLARR